MKKTFTTVMPDKVGAFRLASEIMVKLGLNITRVSYNKAVDVHLLFIEVEGGENAVAEAEKRLVEAGYISDGQENGNVILMEFTLKDVPGSILPILDLISSYNFNISYMSSTQENTGYQHFRIGLLIENKGVMNEFLHKAARLCRTRIIDYNKCEQVLDNTVFYVSFAGQIAEDLSLCNSDKTELIVNSNLIMEILRDKPQAQYKTFEFIKFFSDNMAAFHGEKYSPLINSYTADGAEISVIEPPCGSNISIIKQDGGYVFVDGGMCCYRKETLEAVKSVTGQDKIPSHSAIILTHADVDHCGLNLDFDNIYAGSTACGSFIAESEGRDNLREENPLHAPYVRISKILSGYKVPPLSVLHEINSGEAKQEGHFTFIGRLNLYGLCFDVFEGAGGHVRGEIVLIERVKRLLFTGDIYVNVKECDPRQKSFNSLAPYLMTSVDTNPAAAKAEREELFSLLDKGEWLLIGGHGRAKYISI